MSGPKMGLGRVGKFREEEIYVAQAAYGTRKRLAV